MEMNEEKQNREYYQETFREVHATIGMAERLMNMEEWKNKKKAGSVAKWIAIAAVAAVILFAGSNGVAYATTGSTWVEKLFTKDVKLVVEDDRICIVDGDTVIDVTEELNNYGRATGKYQGDGVVMEYEVAYNKLKQPHLDVRYYYEDEDYEGTRMSQIVFGVAGTPTPAP